MAIQAQPFRPAAQPLDTVAVPGPVIPAPQPVQAPRAPAPQLMQSQLPVAPGGGASGFTEALQSFGVSLNRLGAYRAQQYAQDVKREQGAAMAQMSAMNTEELTSHAERVKLEEKNDARIAGTMEAFGHILGSRLVNEARALLAAGELRPNEAPTYVERRVKEYVDKFDHPDFKRVFGPVASDVLTQMQGVKLTAEAEEVKKTFIDSLVARGFEGRTEILSLPEDEQYATIQKWVDDVVEKAGKDKLIDKKDVNGILKRMAGVAKEQGDVLMVKAIVEKKRGNQPALIEFDDDAKRMVREAEAISRQLNDVAIENLDRDLDIKAGEGRLAQHPAWADRDSLFKMGFSSERIRTLEERNEAVQRAYAYERNSSHVQMRTDAIAAGDVTRAPSLHNATDRSIWSEAQIVAMQAQAHQAASSKHSANNAVVLRQEEDAIVNAHAMNLSTKTGDAWAAIQDTEVVLSNGSARKISANEVKERALQIEFDRIDRLYGKDPNVSRNQKVARMISTGMVTKDITETVRLAKSSISATAINQTDPKVKEQAFALALKGLAFYRAFDEQSSIETLRQAVGGDDAVLFLQGADMVSQIMKGGDDIAALTDMAMSVNRPRDDIERDVAKISRDNRLQIINNKALSEMSSFFGNDFVHKTLAINMIQSTAENLVRAGVNYDVALEGVSKHFTRSFESFKGLLVPKMANQTYKEVQDFYIAKLKEANPDLEDVYGEVALVPSVASSAVGRSGSHVLFSTENSDVPVGLAPVRIKKRDGSELTISDPAHLSLATIIEMRDVMRFDMEQGAIAARTANKVSLSDLTGPEKGKLADAAAAEYRAAISSGADEKAARGRAMKFMLDRLEGVNESVIKEATTLLNVTIK